MKNAVEIAADDREAEVERAAADRGPGGGIAEEADDPRRRPSLSTPPDPDDTSWYQSWLRRSASICGSS